MSTAPQYIRYAGTLYRLAEPMLGTALDDEPETFRVELSEPEQITLALVSAGEGDSVYALMSRVRGEMVRGKPGVTMATKDELYDATTALADLLSDDKFLKENEEKAEAAANMLYGFQDILDGRASEYVNDSFLSHVGF